MNVSKRLVFKRAHKFGRLSRRFVHVAVSTLQTIVKFFYTMRRSIPRHTWRLTRQGGSWTLAFMNANQRRLKALYEAREPRLLSEVPDSTIRRQIDTGRVRGDYVRCLYARLGMPEEGWLPKADKKRLDKVCPLPVPDCVYDVAEPS